MTVQSRDIPLFSALNPILRTAYFHDCHSIALPRDPRSPLELYLNIFSRTPAWIDGLMRLRNRVAARAGLKDMGDLGGIDQSRPACAYKIGDRAGIFQLLEIHEHEVILGETDKHLDVKISVTKQDQAGGTLVSVSTVVHVHNAFGRLYMLFVMPAHRVIAPVTLSKLAPKRG